MLIDTHAHLHHEGLKNRIDEVVENAHVAGINVIVNVGTNEADSVEAVEVTNKYQEVYATVGLHPEDASIANNATWPVTFRRLLSYPKVVAIGECGLDYYRLEKGRPDQSQTSNPDYPQTKIKSLTSATRQWQEQAFRIQIELALEYNKPMVWHVRPSAPSIAAGTGDDAFDDFFRIVDEYPGLRGIVHCFSSTTANMKKAVERGFLIALNGIMTFTKDEVQLAAAKAVPLQNLVLETDCPFLTPVPRRGKVNEPANAKFTAEFLAQLRGESFNTLGNATSRNAAELFGIKV